MIHGVFSLERGACPPEQYADDAGRCVIDPNAVCTCHEIEDLFPMRDIPGFALGYFRRPEDQFQLGLRNEKITRGVIVVHGAARNPNDYFCFMQNSVFQYFGQNNDSVIVVAPWFAEKADSPKKNQIYWPNGHWRTGGQSSATIPATISSYGALDNIIETFINVSIYPNMRDIVITGHSAGGPVTQRYSLGNVIHEAIVKKGLNIRYAPANPSSMTYLIPGRPEAVPTQPTCDTLCVNTTIPSIHFNFITPNSSKDCGGKYNHWGYGLENLNEYMTQRTKENLINSFPQRNVSYLLGVADVCNHDFHCGCEDHGLDTSCSGLLLGWCRYERGHAYYQHLEHVYGKAVHNLVECPHIEHDGCGMLQCPTAKVAMFA